MDSQKKTQIELRKVKIPSLGENVKEYMITKWFVKEGDIVEENDMLFEVTTNKVDSEIPSPYSGKLHKIIYDEGSNVSPGETIAYIGVEKAETSNYCSQCGAKIIRDSSFCSECGVKIDFNLTNTKQEVSPKVEEDSIANPELDEDFAMGFLHSMKKFVERSSEIKNEDDLQEEDIQLAVELQEGFDKINKIAEEREPNKMSDDGDKLSFSEILEFVITIGVILTVIISLIIYYPEYKDNLPEWISSIFE